MKLLLTLSLYFLTSHLHANGIIDELIDEEREYIVNIKSQIEKKISLSSQSHSKYSSFLESTKDMSVSIIDLSLADFDYFRDKKIKYLESLSHSELVIIRSAHKLKLEIENEAFNNIIKFDKSIIEAQDLSTSIEDTKNRIKALETLNHSSTLSSEDFSQATEMVKREIKEELDKREYDPEVEKFLLSYKIDEPDFNAKELLYIYRTVSTEKLELLAEASSKKAVIDYNDEVSSHWRLTTILKMTKVTTKFFISSVYKIFESFPKGE